AEQAGDGAIDAGGLAAMLLHVAVGVPVVVRAGVDQLDDADAALDEPPRHEALPAEGAVVAAADAVEAEGRVALARQVEDLRRLAHHAGGDVEGVDAA